MRKEYAFRFGTEIAKFAAPFGGNFEVETILDDTISHGMHGRFREIPAEYFNIFLAHTAGPNIHKTALVARFVY